MAQTSVADHNLVNQVSVNPKQSNDVNKSKYSLSYASEVKPKLNSLETCSVPQYVPTPKHILEKRQHLVSSNKGQDDLEYKPRMINNVISQFVGEDREDVEISGKKEKNEGDKLIESHCNSSSLLLPLQNNSLDFKCDESNILSKAINGYNKDIPSTITMPIKVDAVNIKQFGDQENKSNEENTKTFESESQTMSANIMQEKEKNQNCLNDLLLSNCGKSMIPNSLIAIEEYSNIFEKFDRESKELVHENILANKTENICDEILSKESNSRARSKQDISSAKFDETSPHNVHKSESNVHSRDSHTREKHKSGSVTSHNHSRTSEKHKSGSVPSSDYSHTGEKHKSRSNITPRDHLRTDEKHTSGSNLTPHDLKINSKSKEINSKVKETSHGMTCEASDSIIFPTANADHKSIGSNLSKHKADDEKKLKKTEKRKNCSSTSVEKSKNLSWSNLFGDESDNDLEKTNKKKKHSHLSTSDLEKVDKKVDKTKYAEKLCSSEKKLNDAEFKKKPSSDIIMEKTLSSEIEKNSKIESFGQINNINEKVKKFENMQKTDRNNGVASKVTEKNLVTSKHEHSFAGNNYPNEILLSNLDQQSHIKVKV